MDGNKRRQAIIDILKNSLQPVSGTYLAKTLQVSRQSLFKTLLYFVLVIMIFIQHIKDMF